MTVASEIKIGGKPAGIAVAPGGSRAYVTSPESKEVSIIDANARAVVAKAKVGEGPLGVAFDVKRKRVIVADWYAHKIFAVDGETAAVVGEAEVGLSPSGVAVTPDGASNRHRRPRQRPGNDS